MGEKRIYTHVTTKMLRGFQALAKHTGRDVYLWPTPYKRSDGRTGWTVVTIREGLGG